MDAVAHLCYAPAMPVPTYRKITRWIFDHMLWDTAGTAGAGFWPGLWATRKLLLALVGSAVLTGWEWVERHPPDMAIVAIVHFVFVFTLIALLVVVGLWFRGRRSPSEPGPRSL